MPGIGPMELVIVLAIALLVLGPKKLPQVGKQLGTGMREFKGAISGVASTASGDLDAERADHPVEP